ncbi:FAD:protein FMN transferase [Microbacterium sp. zg.B48]|uniref:FAD:protein FMN transferase n=1 Tax=Microbacterium sp. zg.B48 TaxID=2969408 RepID=UPI00214D0D78|nr:FAD:protein FMN transferase [Microbacterium sp. zg.B48]MCR2762335.1 FAD:protein FMN transferase [Microbacterium sp. zg.B48]
MAPPDDAGRSAGAARPAVWRFDAIGTRWQIDTPAPLDARARVAVLGVIAEFDRQWSRFRSDSLVAALAGGAEAVPAPPDASAMLDAFDALSAATAGAVNPLVGASLEAHGYDAGYRLVDRGAAPAPANWQDVLSWDGGMLRLTEPAVLDVGALGKGRLVDRVAEALEPWTRDGLVVDASGDMVVRGGPHRIGLEHPYDARRAIGVVEVTDAALCASATNRRSWGEGLHHVLDARTGEPVRTIAATWAIAPASQPSPAMRADAIATALFFDGGPQLAAQWRVEWVRMSTDGRVEWSPGSTAELFA